MPQVLLRFLDVVADDRASLTELATLVGQDPGLSARLLAVANSPPLRRDRGVTSLEECLATLGTGLARTIAECLAIDGGPAGSAQGTVFDVVADIWRHSLRVAETARAIALRTNCCDADEAYLAGLLHDIGQLLLLGRVDEHYGSWVQDVSDEGKLCDVELLLFGTDHAAVGGCLVDQWQLSSFLADAILFHHKSHDEIVDADPLSKTIWSSHVTESWSEQDLATVTSMLRLDLSELEVIRDRAFQQVAGVAATLGVTSGSDPAAPPSQAPASTNDRPGSHHDGLASSQLEVRVRDLALLHSLQQNLPTLRREEDILQAVHESARVLFGLGRLAFFFVDPDEAVLTTPTFAGHPVLLQQIPLKLDGRSLAAAAVRDKQPRSTFDQAPGRPVPLCDVQVARALGSEGVLYVPMCIRERRIGIMAYGLTPAQHIRVQTLLPRMTSFGQQAALSIQAWRDLRANEEAIVTALTFRFQQHARKVVHEAGNPLSIIKNYLKIVSQKLPVDNAADQELGILREEVDRVALILQRLGDLGEIAPARESVDINGMIDGMLAVYGESLFCSQGVTVEKDLAPALLPITGDRDSLKQILLNLWSNAADALGSGDRFVISTTDHVVFNGRCYVEIRLSDSGPGLPRDVMERLFQPLDGRRRPGHCGIGLSIVAALVESLDGLIMCRSSAGKGTSFVILLPRNMESPDEQRLAVTTGSGAGQA
jgi:signal transduction histidine kinase/HD-like signal output (HDOD) protein